MSAAAKVLCSGSRSGSSVRELEKRNTAHTAPRFLTAAELMSRGTGVVLPHLAEIQSELQWVSDDRSLVTLARRLLELGIGVPVEFVIRSLTARRPEMHFDDFSFGSLRIDESTYEHDLVIDRGEIRDRKKKPSKKFRDDFGHTPLSITEEIPWKCAFGSWPGNPVACS